MCVCCKHPAIGPRIPSDQDWFDCGELNSDLTDIYDFWDLSDEESTEEFWFENSSSNIQLWWWAYKTLVSEGWAGTLNIPQVGR